MASTVDRIQVKVLEAEPCRRRGKRKTKCHVAGVELIKATLKSSERGLPEA